MRGPHLSRRLGLWFAGWSLCERHCLRVPGSVALTFVGRCSGHRGPAQRQRMLRSWKVSGAVLLAQGALRMLKVLCAARIVFISGRDCGHLCDTATVLCDSLIVSIFIDFKVHIPIVSILISLKLG